MSCPLTLIKVFAYFSLLSQWRISAAGALLGGAYGIKKSKGLYPMAIGLFAGTIGDFTYGFTMECNKDAQIWLKKTRGSN